MKFNVNRTELLKGLQIVQKAIGSSIIIPITECINFDIKDDELILTATNMETFISAPVKIESSSKLNISIPASRLITLIKDLPNQSLEFSMDGKRVNIKSESGKYTIPYETDEFPVMPIENPAVFEIESAILLDSIDKTTFAANPEHVDERCHGIYFEIKQNEFAMTATNKNILSNFKNEIFSESSKNLFIPQKSLSIIASVNPSGIVKIQANDRNISFEFSGVTIKSAVLDVSYLDYNAIISKSNDNILNIERSILIGAIKRVSSFSLNENTTIKLILSDNSISVSSSNHLEEEATETLICDYSGESIEMGMNGIMLLSCLLKHDCDVIKLMFKDFKTMVLLNDESKPGLIMFIAPIIL